MCHKGGFRKHYQKRIGQDTILLFRVFLQKIVYMSQWELLMIILLFLILLWLSTMHHFGYWDSWNHVCIWLENVGGKLETRYRYSAGLVYNTFPVPELSTRRKNEIEELIGNILDIREEEGGTLAELYGSPLAAKNPKPMNPRLLEAHKELDKVVDRAYKSTDFKDDNERLALLLNMYSEMVNKKG